MQHDDDQQDPAGGGLAASLGGVGFAKSEQTTPRRAQRAAGYLVGPIRPRSRLRQGSQLQMQGYETVIFVGIYGQWCVNYR
jgi:hypothetical protein